MKKCILFVLLMSLISVNAISQELADWRFGIKAQPSISWLSTIDKDFENGKAKLNLGYGLMIEKGLWNKKTVALITGLLVNDFGGNYNSVGDQRVVFQGEDSILFDARKLKLKYVEIPLALKFRTPEINYLTYYANFGVDVGFRVKAISDDQFRDIRTTPPKKGTYNDKQINNDVGFMRMGLNIGMGAEYSIAGSTSLTFGLAYVNGFTNLMRKEAEMLQYMDTGKGIKQLFYGHAVNLNIGLLF